MEGIEQRQTPHVFLILAVLHLLASALTWLIPAGSYEQEFLEADGQTEVVPGSFAYTAPSPVSPWQLPRLLFEALTVGSAPQLIFFVLFLGGAFEIILESGAVTALCAWIIRRFRQRCIWIVAAFVAVFSVFGFTMGLTIVSVVFFPLGITAAKSLGCDEKTGMAMVMLGTSAGFAAGIYNPFSVGIAQIIAERPLYSGAWLRWLLQAALVPVAVYILRRAGEPALSGGTGDLCSRPLLRGRAWCRRRCPAH